MRTQFDKIIWNDFERPKDGPQGVGQDARSNPPLQYDPIKKRPEGLFFMDNSFLIKPVASLV